MFFYLKFLPKGRWPHGSTSPSRRWILGIKREIKMGPILVILGVPQVPPSYYFKDVPIFISASAILAYRHFFFQYRHIAYPMKIIWKYRQYWHIGKHQYWRICISAKTPYRHVLILLSVVRIVDSKPLGRWPLSYDLDTLSQSRYQYG